MNDDPRHITDEELAALREWRINITGMPVPERPSLTPAIDAILARNPPPDPDEALIRAIAAAAESAYYDPAAGGFISVARAALAVMREWEADDEDRLM